MLKFIWIILAITVFTGAQLCSPGFEARPDCRPCPIGFFSGEAGNRPCRKCGLNSTTAAIGSTSYANCSSLSPAAPLWFPREIYLSDFYHANILKYWTKGTATTILDSGDVELTAELGVQRGIFMTKAPLPISPAWQVAYTFNLTVRTISISQSTGAVADSFTFLISSTNGNQVFDLTGAVFMAIIDLYQSSVSQQCGGSHAFAFNYGQGYDDAKAYDCWLCMPSFVNNGPWTVNLAYNLTSSLLKYGIWSTFGTGKNGSCNFDLTALTNAAFVGFGSRTGSYKHRGVLKDFSMSTMAASGLNYSGLICDNALSRCDCLPGFEPTSIENMPCRPCSSRMFKSEKSNLMCTSCPNGSNGANGGTSCSVISIVSTQSTQTETTSVFSSQSTQTETSTIVSTQSTQTETTTITTAPLRPQLPQTIAPPEKSKGDTDIVTIVAASAAGGVLLLILMLFVWHVRKGKAQIIVKPALLTPTANLYLESLYQPGQMPPSGTLMYLSQFLTQPFQPGSMQRPPHLSRSSTQPFQQGPMQRSPRLSQTQTQPFQQGPMQLPFHLPQTSTQLFQQGFMNRPPPLAFLTPFTNTSPPFNQTSLFFGAGRGSATRNSLQKMNVTQTLTAASPTMQF